MAEGIAAAGIELGQHHAATEGNVAGGELDAVMPHHVGTQMKQVGQAIRRHFKGLGQIGLRLELPVEQEQGLINIAADLLHDAGVEQRIVQVRRFIGHHRIDDTALVRGP